MPMNSWTSEAGPGQPDIRGTYAALADAIIPRTPGLSWEAGAAYLAGGAQWAVGQYLAMTLDRSPAVRGLPLATAWLLDAAAGHLIATGRVTTPLNPYAFPGGGRFASLSRGDRIRVLALLEQMELDPNALPPPYRESPWLVAVTIDVLNRSTAMGFYSEWPGYGTTRLLPPDQMELECFPPGWLQARFPGPSLGYRALRGYPGAQPSE